MSGPPNPIVKILLASFLFICGCGPTEAPNNQKQEPKLIETVEVSGFDPDGEPVIKMWSDGILSIEFEAMPPFFAEDQGAEQEFENFETKIQEALGVEVRRDDREKFVIEKPNPDTAKKAKAWLETYRKK